MHSSKDVEGHLAKILTFIGALCMAGIVTVIILNVILRFVFNAPIMWSIEGCSILVVWMTFIVFGVNHREKLHFRIDAIVQLFKPRIRRYITMVADLLTLVCLGFLLYSSIIAVIANGMMPMMTIELPVMFTFYLPMLIGILSYIFYGLISLGRERHPGGGKP